MKLRRGVETERELLFGWSLFAAKAWAVLCGTWFEVRDSVSQFAQENAHALPGRGVGAECSLAKGLHLAQGYL